MTYGDNVRQMRASMTQLLNWHRILLRLGAAHASADASTTVAEREHMGQVIQRYRAAALTWCDEAVDAVTPTTDIRAFHMRTPSEELRFRIHVTAVAARRAAEDSAGDGHRLSDLLGVHHDNPMLHTWQQLARAAAVGERDFGAGVNLGVLSQPQANAVLTDVAHVARGLALLDPRYYRVPGWTRMEGRIPLDHAAEAIAVVASGSGLDASVNEYGWRPPAGRIDGLTLPGLAGAVQAQHNLLIELSQLPNALNLRRILHSQAQASHHAARHAAVAAPDLAQRFATRASLYRELVRASRDIGGVLGAGAHAVIESQHALTRLQAPLAAPTIDSRYPLQQLARIMTRTDARIRTTVERGVHEAAYLVAERTPHLSHVPDLAVHRQQQRWAPVTAEQQTELLPLVRQRLTPVPLPTVAEIRNANERSRLGEAVPPARSAATVTR